MPTFWKGRKKRLDSKDLYKTLSVHKSDMLGNKLSEAWEKELQHKKSSKSKPSLLMATLRVFGGRFALYGLVLFLLEIGMRSIQPLFLLGFIAYYTKDETNEGDLRQAYLFASCLVISCALNVIIMHPYMLGAMHVGMKARVAMCSMIYRKALRLSRNALGNTTAGEVVNLISNDVARFDTAMIFLHYLWLGPLQTVVVTYLMYCEIGIAGFFGVAFMLLLFPFQVCLGKRMSVLRLRTALRTDERVRMMNEIISGIQVIKMYAWEIPFGKMVANARKKEVDSIRQSSYIRGVLFSFIMFSTRVSIFLSLVAFVLLSNILTPEKAFVIVAYYNILRPTMTIFFPQGIGLFAETLVSIRRIQNYMQYEETSVRDKSLDNPEANNTNSKLSVISNDDDKSYDLEPSAPDEPLLKDTDNATLSEAAVVMNNVKAKWDPQSPEYTLDEVNLRVQPGTLVAIIGPVGSGKSSLIQSILGELRPESGTIQVNGTFSYASQEPWLFTGTVRQNILFGQPMNKRRYYTVVRKCALERDFELLPHGDKTIVGDRGASLSGGQKARINLARAVYRKTLIYLLDDPLSAVDTLVGRYLFEQCMRDFLKENIVILVTHQLQFLEHADQIVIMEKGKVSAVGTYGSLRKSVVDFAQLLADPEKDDMNRELRKKSSGSGSQINRQSSEVSLYSIPEAVTQDTEMQQQETQGQGKIGLSLYKKYFEAGGGFCVLTILSMFCLAAQGLASGGDYFLNYWVAKKKVESENNDTTTQKSSGMENFLNENGLNFGGDSLDVYIFTFITIAVVTITMARSFMFFNMAMRASNNLHNAMFRGITRASMYFFNTNPAGRILNRFSKDIGQVDELLPAVMLDVIQIFLGLLAIVIVIAVVNPFLLAPTLILGIIFYNLRTFYLKTSREVKRLEAITRSPIYSHMAATLTGLSTIRAFGAQQVLIREFDNHQDLHSSAFYLFISTSRAFGYWLDCFCVIFIAIVTFSFFLFPAANGGDVGLAITQALGMTGMVQWGMRQSTELENTMTAVERIVEYDDIEPEGELDSKPDKKPPKEWPQDGKIIFEELSVRYFPDPKAETVLKSLSFEIQPCEKVGIVGRTGAGKSSLINALFRLSFNEGSIIIDGRDIKELGLHDLRSKISIIPQEPVLFSGTMRYNLDPFDEYSDAKLWESLEEVELKSVVAELPSGLQSRISEGGSNFSVGQRQLVCLARAILRENKILVMDEATANVDPQTDTLIQTTIRNKFKNCTVLTIAHRLHTVMDSDKVLVMDAGQVVEFGSPYELLTESETKIFHSMVKQTGRTTFENLLKVAENAHLKKQRENME